GKAFKGGLACCPAEAKGDSAGNTGRSQGQGQASCGALRRSAFGAHGSPGAKQGARDDPWRRRRVERGMALRGIGEDAQIRSRAGAGRDRLAARALGDTLTPAAAVIAIYRDAIVTG